MEGDYTCQRSTTAVSLRWPIARLATDDEGRSAIELLDLDSMHHIVARAADWFKYKRVEENTCEVDAYPPSVAIRDLLATPEPPLPILTRIVEAPVFARDGTLQTKPGYHAASRTYYAPAAGFVVPDVPLRPTPRQIGESVALITMELLGDFPFTSDAERAHAVGLLLAPFARELIDGAIPLHLFEKPTPGTGATLLTDMLAFPSLGRPLPAMTEGRNEEEWRKRITAKLKDGPSHVLLDNLRGRLDSAALSAAITTPVWEDRLLGVSQNIRIPVHCTWIATGNNPTLSNEMTRRTVRIRLDAKIDEPWLRDGFRHPDLRTWARENRGQLVWAALVLIQAWLAEGRPKLEGRNLGMLESWSETIGGILAVAGIPCFLANLADFYRETDDEAAGWRQFIAHWWGQHGSSEVTVKDVWAMINGDEEGSSVDAPCDLGDGSERSRKTRFGKALAKMRDRVFTIEVAGNGDAWRPEEPVAQRLRLDRAGTRHQASTWNLTPVE